VLIFIALYFVIVCYYIGFEYDTFKLSRSELIFYYERLTVRGICLSLFAEFQSQLSCGGYRLVRLVRPSEQHPDSAILLAQSQQQHLGHFTDFVSGLLTKPADKIADDVEVITRDGMESCGRNVNVSRSRLAVDNFTSRSRRGGQNRQQAVVVVPDGVVTYETLRIIPGLSIARLREIGAAEGVNWKDYKNGTMKKSDYLEAFAAHRRAQRCVV